VPRSSPFSIDLSDKERTEMESRARKYTSPYRDVLRAKIILLACRRFVQRCHCFPFGFASPDRQQVAKALLSRASAGTRGTGPRRAASPFFRPTSSLRLKLWLANCLMNVDCLCPRSRFPRSVPKFSIRASPPVLVELLCGVGSAKMPSDPGDAGVGCFHVTRTSL
jgi:hypothetical protein